MIVARSFASLVAAVLCAECVAGCTGGDGGAVVVRWQLVDPATGVGPPDCKDAIPNHPDYCCDQLQTANPNVQDQVVIDAMHLEIVPVSTDGGSAAIQCASCTFACAQSGAGEFSNSAGEHATGFDIPPGDYYMSLQAMRCGAPVGNTPPAVRRTITLGGLTNLNAIEVLLSPNTRTCGDSVDLK